MSVDMKWLRLPLPTRSLLTPVSPKLQELSYPPAAEFATQPSGSSCFSHQTYVATQAVDYDALSTIVG